MTLLSIVQDACDDIGFPAPASVIGNSAAAQYLRLINREGESLSKRPWEALVKEHTFTLVTADQDYDLPADFRYIIPSTQWNRDNKRHLIWINSQEYQFFKGWTTVNGLNLRARIRNNLFEFEQDITASDNGKVIAFEYVSKYWAKDSGSVAKHMFTDDTDTSSLDEELLTLGLIWRIKKAKGLDWQPDFGEYADQVNVDFARDGGMRNMRMTENVMQHLGVNTQEGNFPGP